MIETRHLDTFFNKLNITSFSGVPCSYLQPLFNYACNAPAFVMAANEGDAVAHAVGSWLGGKNAAVLMQNSGLGNAVSPLTSLSHVYRIPLLGFVSLRGSAEHPDEPQHALMGQITGQLLSLMKLEYAHLSSTDSNLDSFPPAILAARENRESFFFIVEKGAFEKENYLATRRGAPETKLLSPRSGRADRMTRQSVLEILLETVPENAVLIATTGFTGRELYALQDRATNFYMVGSMGCAGSLALGLAQAQPTRPIIVLDGDGALLMRLGNLSMIGTAAPKNLMHIVFQNGLHESTGGQPIAAPTFDFIKAACAAGYPQVTYQHGLAELMSTLNHWLLFPDCTFACIPLIPGTMENLGRPATSPPEVALRLRTTLSAPL